MIYQNTLTLQRINCAWLVLQVSQDADGFALEALEPGRLMAQHYMRFKTMALMSRAPPQLQMIDLIMLLAQVSEPF